MHRASNALVVLSAVLLAGMAVWLLPLEPSLVSLQLTYSPEGFAAVYSAWSPLAKARFAAHLWLDYAFLVVYAAWGYCHATTTRSAQSLAEGTKRLMQAALPAAAVLDVIENALHQFITAAALPIAPWPYAVAGCAATGKWLLVLGFFAGLALLAWRHRAGARLVDTPKR